MKNMYLLVLGLLFSFALQAQNRIDEKNRTVVDKMLSNRPKQFPANVIVSTQPLDSTFVRVVDNKIYRGKSLEFDLIPKDQLELTSSVIDLQSTNGIRSIFIYKRKKQ